MIEIIPAIDIIEGRCVRLRKGDYNEKTVYDCKPEEMVARYADAGIIRVHAVDLDGAKAGRPVNLRSLEKMASVSDNVAIEWGGGLKTSDDLRSAFSAGMRYAVAGSIAVKNPALLEKWLEEYTPQAIVLGADVRNGKVAVAGWLEDSEATVDSLVDRFAPFGLSQAIVTEISRDGMLGGPDFDLYTRLQKKYPDVDFTVSGGVSSLNDIMHAGELGLRKIIVGKAIYEGHITLDSLCSLNA